METIICRYWAPVQFHVGNSRIELRTVVKTTIVARFVLMCLLSIPKPENLDRRNKINVEVGDNFQKQEPFLRIF